MNKLEANADVVLQLYKSGSPAEKQKLINLFGKDAFKEADGDWLKQFEEFCKENNIDYAVFMKNNEQDEEDELAYKMLKKIISISNGKWVADIRNKNQRKYFPVFYWDETAGFGFSRSYCDNTSAHTHVGSRLYSETDEKAVSIAKKYVKIYEKYHTNYNPTIK